MAVRGGPAETGVAAPEVEGGGFPFLTLWTATLSITLGALPVFLLGAMAVFIRPEMGFGESALGALVSLYYLASAVTTVPAGRLAERLGSRRAMGVAAALAFAAGSFIALVASSWSGLAVGLVIAGVANGTAFPSSNLAVAKGIPPRWQGVAFGVKQSAGPYATLLAGAAVPLVGLTVGWRWAFALAGMAAIPLIWRARTRRDHGVGPHDGGGRSVSVPVGALWLMSLAAFCGVNASASLGAFYVESAVQGGVGPALAGTFLSIGSLSGILARIAWGRLADRRSAIHFLLVPALLLMGAPAFAMLGFVEGALPLLLSTLLVFATGWAWPSLLNFAVIRRTPGGPGRASGILGAGQFGGGILGPFLFGVVVERTGYPAAWSAAGLMLAAAALLAVLAGRSLERSLPTTVGAT